MRNVKLNPRTSTPIPGKAKPTLLYLLARLDNDIIYDSVYTIVVRASSANAARSIAHTERADEVIELGDDVWLSAEKSSCVRLVEEGKPGVIIMDTLNG